MPARRSPRQTSLPTLALDLPPPDLFDPLTVLLDPHNPRLLGSEEGASQARLLEVMISEFKAEELAQSIAASGFLKFDPMLAVREDGHVVVVEGNRRLAAIQMLLDPSRAPEKRRGTWGELSAKLPAAVRESLRQIPIHILPSRADPTLNAYLGFRHVSGVLQWPPAEKARFILRMVDEAHWGFDVLADRFGTSRRDIERHYLAIRVVQQAHENGVPGADDMEENFGVLLRALQTRGIASFLGVRFTSEPASGSPVPKAKSKDLTDFVRWTFGIGEEDVPPVLQESRFLTKWGKILQSKPGIEYLRREDEPTFDKAWYRAGGESESLVEALSQASYRLAESVPTVSVHKEEDGVKFAVRECSRFLYQVLQYFPDLYQQVKDGSIAQPLKVRRKTRASRSG